MTLFSTIFSPKKVTKSLLSSKMYFRTAHDGRTCPANSKVPGPFGSHSRRNGVDLLPDFCMMCQSRRWRHHTPAALQHCLLPRPFPAQGTSKTQQMMRMHICYRYHCMAIHAELRLVCNGVFPSVFDKQFFVLESTFSECLRHENGTLNYPAFSRGTAPICPPYPLRVPNNACRTATSSVEKQRHVKLRHLDCFLRASTNHRQPSGPPALLCPRLNTLYSLFTHNYESA